MSSMESLLDRVGEQERHVHLLDHHSCIVEWRRRLCYGMAGLLMMLSLVGLPLQSAHGQELERRVSALERRVSALERDVEAALVTLGRRVAALEAGNVTARIQVLENTLRPVTRVAEELVITGVN